MTATYSIHSLLCYPSTMLVSAIPFQCHGFDKSDERIRTFLGPTRIRIENLHPCQPTSLHNSARIRSSDGFCDLGDVQLVVNSIGSSNAPCLNQVEAQFGSTDKHRNGKRRAEETGGCVHAEGGVYGTDIQSTGAFATLDAYCTAKCELSSALAMYWMIHDSIFHHLTPQVRLIHRTLRLSFVIVRKFYRTLYAQSDRFASLSLCTPETMRVLTLPDVFNFPNLRHLTITLPASFNFHLFSTATLETCCISIDDYSPASPGEPNKLLRTSNSPPFPPINPRFATLDWKLEQADEGERGRVTRFEALAGVLGQSGIDYFTTETAGEQDRWVNKVVGAPPGVSLDARRDFWVNKTTDSERYMYQVVK
ncbi:hypothetical protein ARMGADRAFT_1084633 [Armillaria gallica]|uniref:Uncharacterized protein n=1 Tax=Armillaria gallica TaxID=47427 RepID=A0A2H3DLH6_ARMGA|nr:hypothetical protein ARMGADRAFT_1084633 [Armillaria gallica]